MGDGLLPDAGSAGESDHLGLAIGRPEHPTNPNGKPGNLLLKSGLRLITGQVARQGYLSGFDQALISLTNFLATLLLARSVNPTQFGAYGVGFLLLHLGRAIQEGLVVQPLAALGPGLSASERKGYLSGAAGLQIGLAVAGALACAGLGWLLTETGNTVAGPTLFALWFPVVAAQPQEFLRRYFYTTGEVNRAVINSGVAGSVRLAVMAGLLFHGGESGTIGLVAIGWGALAGLGLGLLQTTGAWRISLRSAREAWGRNWTFGKWLVGGTVASWVAGEVYPILTAGLISFAAAGAYRALQNVVAPIHALLRAMDTYFTPRLADRRSLAGSVGVAHMLRRMYLVTGPPTAAVLIGAVVFAEPLLRLFYGETYVAYAPGMQLMALFYGLWYLYFPLQSALKAVERTRPIFVGSLIASLSMATVGVWAVLRWDVYGTIAGQALSAGILAVVLGLAWARWRAERPTSTSGEPAAG